MQYACRFKAVSLSTYWQSPHSVCIKTKDINQLYDKELFQLLFFWDSMYSGRAAQSSFPPDSVLSQPRQWCHLYRQCRELCATITTSAWFCPRSLDNAIVWSFLGHLNNPGKLTVSEPLLKSLTLPGLRKLHKATHQVVHFLIPDDPSITVFVHSV